MVIMRQAQLPAIVCLATTVFLAGCRDNDFADTIHLDAGDAIARNKAIQTIDPWPRRAFKKRHSTNGQRIERAYDKYQGTATLKAEKAP